MKNLKTLPKLMVAFGVNLTLFLILLVICYSGFRTMIEARDAVLHTNAVFDSIDNLRIDLLQIRADMRDLAIDELEPSTETLEAGITHFRTELDAFEEMTIGNPRHQSAIDVLQRQYREWLSQVGPAFRLSAKGEVSQAALRDFVLSDPGEQTFESMQATLERVREDERNLLHQHSSEMEKLESYTMYALAGGGTIILAAGALLSLLISMSITRPLSRITAYARRIAHGDYSFPLEIEQKDEVGELATELRSFQRSMTEKTRLTEAIAAGDLSRKVQVAGEKDTLGHSINRMVAALRLAEEHNQRTNWKKTGLNEIATRSTGETDARRLAERVLGFLAPYLNAQIATLYLADENQKLTLQAGYAVDFDQLQSKSIDVGQGLVGQAGKERRTITLDSIPEGYLRISSSIGDCPPRSLLALPFVHQGRLIGVLELASLEPFPEYMLEFLEAAADSLGTAFDTIKQQAKVRDLLEQTQKQALQLQEQQEELQTANEELEEHTVQLEQSEEELKQQREELQVINEELEEKNEALEKQKTLIKEKNQDLEQAWEDIKRKAAELEISSKYKSEFLANMSHELRTPLNSLLLLSRSLRDNTSGTLSPEDLESAAIIHKNGTDLLNLINDILDLSKIEAGKMTVKEHQVHLAEVAGSILMDFRHIAEEKGLALECTIEDGLPASIRSDRQRLEQILRNLVSNALKFTEQGQVSVRFYRPDRENPQVEGLSPGQAVAIEVRDTGIGISSEKQIGIFEAFQQGDGGTSRRFGGTGLGLTIARQLARLLGGDITLVSDGSSGTTFTLYLPMAGRSEKEREPARKEVELESPLAQPVQQERPMQPAALPSIPDDRDAVEDQDKVILIIEDDPDFAQILLNLCRRKGFKALVSTTGEEGLVLAERFLPTGVLLDIRLPGISGWTVLNSLKRNHQTRHIPVHIISVNGEPQDALNMGAVGFLSKPVSSEGLEQALSRIESVSEKKIKKLLLVEDNAELRTAIHNLLGGLEVRVTEAENGKEAIEAIQEGHYDCMILDLGLADMNGFDLLKRLERDRETSIPPVIVYTGKELTKEEELELRRYSETIIIKGARSEERLLDEATLFLHKMVSTLPQTKQRMILNLHNRDAALEGKKILLVDDDMRNLFALSKVLTEKGLQVRKAEDGAAALEMLAEEDGIDLVVMDIMMPGIDGYEAMRRIRRQPQFSKLPIIALTAKAMKEDREKCIEAGASDYLAKPVDVDKILSMMRVWLYRR